MTKDNSLVVWNVPSLTVYSNEIADVSVKTEANGRFFTYEFEWKPEEAQYVKITTALLRDADTSLIRFETDETIKFGPWLLEVVAYHAGALICKRISGD